MGSFVGIIITVAALLGGFAAMDWVTATTYGAARPDPLADAAGSGVHQAGVVLRERKRRMAQVMGRAALQHERGCDRHRHVMGYANEPRRRHGGKLGVAAAYNAVRDAIAHRGAASAAV